ncbi:MAG: flagellar basal body-associated FliL family protein [Actinomycetaceae bacterium]|nr:flagellar basal body-associated FliL family protein [Actinomycetaceae bacterium]
MPVGTGAPTPRPATPPPRTPPKVPPRTPPAARPGGGGAAPEPLGEEQGGKGGKLKLIIIIAAVLVVLGAIGVAVYLFFFAGSGEAKEDVPVTKKVGSVAMSTGDQMNINLQDGNFLAFQATIYFDDKVEAAPDPTPARQVALNIFMGGDAEKLNTPRGMEEKKELYLEELNKLQIEQYKDHVVEVFFSVYSFQIY